MADWHVPKSAFAPIIAVGLIGMSLGSLFAGPIGDRLGRRKALISTVLVFAAATLSIAFATTIPMLAILRFFAGAGIGGAIPNAAAIAAEFVPLHRRAFAVSLTIVCVPVGGMTGGILAAQVLPTLGWRALFAIGGIAPAVLCLLLYGLMPESPGFLAERKPQSRIDLASIFGPAYWRDTLSLWLASFCCLLSVYTSFSWLPTLLTAEGFTLAAASSGL